MKHQFRRSVAAVAIAALMAALSVWVVLPATTPQSSPAAGQTLSPAQAHAIIVGAADAAAAKMGMNQTQRASLLAAASAQTEASVLAKVGLSPADFQPSCFVSCFGTVLGVGAVGCLVGGGIGAIGGAFVGAGIGCVVGAAATIFAFEYGTSMAEQQNVLQSYSNWATATLRSAWNDWNLTQTAYENLMSALNFSAPGWARMADNAALLQVGNSSFNIVLDAQQSGLAAQFSSVLESYTQQLIAPVYLLQNWMDAQGPTGSTYGSVRPGMSCTAGACTAMGQPTPGQATGLVGQGSTMVTLGATSANGEFYIPPGDHTVYGSDLTIPPVVHPVFGKGWYSMTQVGSPPPSGSVAVVTNYTYNFTAGTYAIYVNNSGASGEIWVPGGSLVTSALGTDISGWGSPTYGRYIVQFTGIPGSPADQNSLYYTGVEQVAVGTTFQFWQCAGCLSGSTTVGPTGSGITGPVPAHIGTWLGNLEFNATTNGQAYWTFLRSAGFTSPGSIPSGCLIPQPWMNVPSDLNLGTLTLPQLESLYLAWLNGVGKFYNTTLSGSAFCGTQAPKQFSLNNTIWGNLFVNATGYVYLNNGTSPVGLNGKALPTELYGNRSTWAAQAVQLLLMPTLSSVTIPLGTDWAIPSTDPVQVYLVQPGQMLTLTGNGTASPATVVPLTSTPGDTLYLTACIVGGVAEPSCTVTVQTVVTTTSNLTCLGGSTGPGSCVSQGSGATFGGFPNPFSWLSGLFSGLFGGGPLGSFLGGLAAGLLILAVLAVLVYVAVVEVEAWGGRKRGGGGGGSTVVIRGGR